MLARALIVVLLLGGAAYAARADRAEVPAERQLLTYLPSTIDAWRGFDAEPRGMVGWGAMRPNVSAPKRTCGPSLSCAGG